MASAPRPYYSEKGLSAAFYDLITDGDRTVDGDVDVYAGLAPKGGEILELGAGSGRVAIALAERGFTVVGVDLAPAMLAQAQAKLAGLRQEVASKLTFRLGDMTALNLGRSFYAVICTYFTLAHVPVGAAWANTFQTIARHLKPGGMAAVHLPRRALMADLPPLDPTLPVLQNRLEDGRGLQLFVRERGFRPNIGRLDQVLEYVLTDRKGALIQKSLERQTYYAGDPTPFAVKAGLTPAGEPVDLGGVGDIYIFARQ